MKATLKTDITLTRMTVNFNSHIDGDDKKTHNINILGYVSHDYIWNPTKQESFEFNFFADKEFCRIVEDYLEKKLQIIDPEQYPREF